MASPTDAGPQAALKARVLKLAPRLACFDLEAYRAANGDLAEVDALSHFAEFGVWEGRKLIAPERLTANLARAVLALDNPGLDEAAMRRAYRSAMRVEPIVHLPPHPGDTDILIAARIGAALEAVGIEARRVEGPPRLDGTNPIVVNPAKVFQGARTPVDLELYAASVTALAVSPGHPDFAAALPYLVASGGVVAAAADTDAMLKTAGVPSLWLSGAYADGGAPDAAPTGHPLLRGLARTITGAPPGLPWAERPIDVVALQPVSPARIQAWSRMADGMARFRTVVYQPPSGALPEAAERALRLYLYARSKIVLNLHEDAPCALPCDLVEEAVTAGALILSEPSSPHPALLPGRHYLESSARRMPEMVDGLLNAEAGAARAGAMTAAAARALSPSLDLETQGLALVNLLLTAAGKDA